jgi:hypothetical protein
MGCYIFKLNNDEHFQNEFFSNFHHEHHFYLLALFSETYIHFETFSYDLVYKINSYFNI